MSTSSTTPQTGSYLQTPLSTASSASSLSDSTFDFHHALVMNLCRDIPLQEVHDLLVSVAKEAGQMILDADPSVDKSESKLTTADLVTQTDKAVESMVRHRLTAAYPKYHFLGEETSKEDQKLDDHPTFVVDPIDGTLNFIHGLPNVAISLALAVGKKPVVGVVYNPERRDLFTAIKGQGAYLTKFDGSVHSLPLRVGQTPLAGLNKCLVAIEWGKERKGVDWNLRMETARRILTDRSEGGAMAHSVRTNGSAALSCCYVAMGAIDVFWEGGCWAWDLAGAWCVLEEAGGMMASANPGDWSPELDGRLYLAVRAAPSGQKEIVEEVWSCMAGRGFSYHN